MCLVFLFLIVRASHKRPPTIPGPPYVLKRDVFVILSLVTQKSIYNFTFRAIPIAYIIYKVHLLHSNNPPLCGATYNRHNQTVGVLSIYNLKNLDVYLSACGIMWNSLMEFRRRHLQ